MRAFEWFLLVTSVAALVLTMRYENVAPSVRHAISGLLAGALAAQLVVEGWRVQIVPIYLVALALLTWSVARSFSSTAKPGADFAPRRRRYRKAITGALAIGLVAGAVIAGWLMPVPTFPRRSGRYAVGIVDREIVDTSRARRLIMSIWYPSAIVGEQRVRTLLIGHPDVVARELARVTGVPALAFQHLRYLTITAAADAPLLQPMTPLPVLVVSHAMLGMRQQLATLARDLASWGYVVIALDHTDAAAVTVFTDGSARPHDLRRLGAENVSAVDRSAMTTHVLPAWVADQRAIYDYIERMNVSDTMFAGALDVQRMASIGHSFGGATALAVCLVDVRCRAAVNLDGGLYGDAVNRPAVRPVLLITSAGSNALPTAISRWSAMVQRSPSAVWFELPRSSHLSFGIVPFLSPLLSPSRYDRDQGGRTIDVCVREFLDASLSVGRGAASGNGQCGAAALQRTPSRAMP